jgi:predicted transcriptional regulator YheO
MSPPERRRLLFELRERGVYDRPRAADAVASALSVSRATVYQDLKDMQDAVRPGAELGHASR